MSDDAEMERLKEAVRVEYPQAPSNKSKEKILQDGNDLVPADCRLTDKQFAVIYCRLAAYRNSFGDHTRFSDEIVNYVANYCTPASVCKSLEDHVKKAQHHLYGNKMRTRDKFERLITRAFVQRFLFDALRALTPPSQGANDNTAVWDACARLCSGARERSSRCEGREHCPAAHFRGDRWCALGVCSLLCAGGGWRAPKNRRPVEHCVRV